MKGTKLVIALTAALTLTSNVSSVEADDLDYNIVKNRYDFISTYQEDTLDEVILEIVKKDTKDTLVNNKLDKRYRLGKAVANRKAFATARNSKVEESLPEENLTASKDESNQEVQEAEKDQVIPTNTEVNVVAAEIEATEEQASLEAVQESIEEPGLVEVAKEDTNEASLVQEQVNTNPTEEVTENLVEENTESQSSLATDTIELIPVEEDDEWMTIDYKGETAYIAADFVEPEEEVEEESQVIEEEVALEIVPEETSQEDLAEESTLAEVAPIEETEQVAEENLEIVEEEAVVEQAAIVEEVPVEEELPVEEEVVVESNNAGTLEALVNEAYQTVGLPYVWAGSSYAGFDCSGLTSYLYQQHFGIWIGRTTYEQVNAGYGVSVSEMKPGDILCFQNNWSDSCDHVGIYVGNGQYVHAATEERGVVTDSTSGNYFQNNLVSVRRIVD